MPIATISDYAVIGDRRSAALVSTSGAMDWLCWPRFDSTAIFAALLDPERGGSWRFEARGVRRTERRCIDRSNVLETRFDTADGTLVLTDLMTVASESEKKRLLLAEHEIIRHLRCERGAVEVTVHLEPRLGFGREPVPHTHSLVLCWVALDRLLALHARGLLPKLPAAHMQTECERIRVEVERHSWSESVHSYTAELRGAEVDASLLLLAWYGFAPPDSPRMRATFRRIEERLRVAAGLYYRYEKSRRLAEGAFGICSFWVADYLARGGGSLAQARAVMTDVLACANDVGLFGEEIDPATRLSLGNFPQAYTHVGLINAALSIAERERAEIDSAALTAHGANSAEEARR